MKLSELINQLQRLHDLYPKIDPEVITTEVAYADYDKDKKNPEFFCRTLDVTCYEFRTFVHLPSESLFSERGPYLNIFYEGDYIDRPEDFWKNTYFQQHANKQSGSIHSSSCSTPDARATVDQQSVSTTPQESDGKQ